MAAQSGRQVTVLDVDADRVARGRHREPGDQALDPRRGGPSGRRGRGHRHQHLGALGHGPGYRGHQPEPVRRSALLQPGAVDARGRDRRRSADRRGSGRQTLSPPRPCEHAGDARPTDADGRMPASTASSWDSTATAGWPTTRPFRRCTRDRSSLSAAAWTNSRSTRWARSASLRLSPTSPCSRPIVISHRGPTWPSSAAGRSVWRLSRWPVGRSEPCRGD